MKKIIFLNILYLICTIVLSQIPNGQWRDHLSYSRGRRLAITPEKVFCSMDLGGMLSYNKATNEVEKLSKVYGLSDVNISAICYSEQEDVLIVGYKNGNIDLLRADNIKNISDIKREGNIQSYNINSIFCYNEHAYLSCDFGIVNLNLTNNEISDSYIFGPGSNEIKVNDLTILDNYIYAATESGIYKADIENSNLVDYSSWIHQSDMPEASAEYIQIENLNSGLMAAYFSSTDSVDRIIMIDESSWQYWNNFPDTDLRDITYQNNKLSITGYNIARIYDESLNEIFSFELDVGYHTFMDKDGVVYTASNGSGFNKRTTESSFDYLVMNCPRFQEMSFVSTYEDQVWVGSGGETRPYLHGGLYNFSDEKWVSYNPFYTEGLDDLGNISKIAIDPSDPNHIFAGTWSYGLIEMQDGVVINRWDETNAEMFNDIPTNIKVRVKGIDFASNGDLWFLLDLVNDPIYVIRADGTWERPDIDNTTLKNDNTSYADLIVTSDLQIWILTESDGVIVLKENADGTFEDLSFKLVNQENEIIFRGYCLEEDLDEEVWIGTNSGPIYYSNISSIFNQDDITGLQILIPRNDGTGLGDFLLGNEMIQDIEIDGANRPWFATAHSGVFLTSEDGLTTIHSFNTDNSPLFNNNVISIGIQKKTGEVFISTDDGMLSYMGQATEGGDDFGDVYVYPNPVEPYYDGDITITGLIRDANVKITDISGNIVYETTSLGGQAVWDGRNFKGQRVATGVYLVFMTNSDGSKTHITKLLFIH